MGQAASAQVIWIASLGLNRATAGVLAEDWAVGMTDQRHVRAFRPRATEAPGHLLDLLLVAPTREAPILRLWG